MNEHITRCSSQQWCGRAHTRRHSRTKRGEVVGAADQRDGHAGDPHFAGACGVESSHDAKVNIEAESDFGNVAADVVIGIHSGGAEGRGERDACDGVRQAVLFL
jgi:hypothetical protein